MLHTATVSQFQYVLSNYERLVTKYGLKLKGQAGLDQVLSVHVPTYFCWFSAEMQYRLLEQMLPEAQQELTFASGSQGKSPATSPLAAW